MQRFNYNDITVKIDGQPLLCLNADASVSNPLSPSILANRQAPDSYVSDSHMIGTAQISYFLVGEDPLSKYMTSGAGPFPLNLGEVIINNAYLSSYSLSVEPFKPVVVQAGFKFYEDFLGQITSRKETSPTKSLLTYNDIEISEFGLGLGGNILSIKYDFGQNIEENVIAFSGNRSVSEVKFLEKQATATITSYKDNSPLPAEGTLVSLSVKSRALEEETENLIFNPNFETIGDILIGYSHNISPSGDIFADEANGGSNSIRLDSNKKIEFIPSVPMEVGQVYTFSVFAKREDATGAFTFTLVGANRSQSFNPTLSMQRLSFTFTFSGSQLLRLQGTAGTSCINSIQLEKKGKVTSFVRHSRGRSLLEINGVAISKRISHSFGAFSSSEYEINQTGFGKKPVFGRFAKASSGADVLVGSEEDTLPILTETDLFIFGLNLSSTSAVIFKQNVEVKDIIIYDDRLISVKVPSFARKGGIKIINSAGEAESVLYGVEKTLKITSNFG